MQRHFTSIIDVEINFTKLTGIVVPLLGEGDGRLVQGCLRGQCLFRQIVL